MADIFDSFPPELAAHMRATVARRELSGTNVHFINERGQKDRYSFETAHEANAFRAQISKKGRKLIK